MYITKVEITSLRNLTKFQMQFPKPAGWHVLIGENGSGKTSIVQAISLALVGHGISPRLSQSLNHWIQNGYNSTQIKLQISAELGIDYNAHSSNPQKKLGLKVLIEADKDELLILDEANGANKQIPSNAYRSSKKGWFSAAFGHFRRLSAPDIKNIPLRVKAHLSIFEPDAPFDALVWLKQLQFQKLEGDSLATLLIDGLILFINQGQLLPRGIQLTKITSMGVYFSNEYQTPIEISQLSSGFQAVLNLILELIQHLVSVYGINAVFEHIKKGNLKIPLSGVVLIDEIDAHLHPTWQAQIGVWLTHYFPNLQFIVTAHSPLICRASEHGSIWRVATPNSMEISEEIVGIEKQQLIYGNILDVYSTKLFGQHLLRSESGNRKLQRLTELNFKERKRTITSDEIIELNELRLIFPSDSNLSEYAANY